MSSIGAPPAADAGTLRLTGLQVSRGGRRVLNGIDLSIGRGWTAIVGPNGAGKSTLLKTLAGLSRPDHGEGWLDGRPLWGPGALAPRDRARRIAWLAQAGEITGDLTLRETVALGRLPHTGPWGQTRPADNEAVDTALAATACAPLQHRLLTTLSGGERQRALIARALAGGADVLLLDEPTSHLDPPHQVALARLARALAGPRTVVTVVHDLDLALAADRVLLLDRGRVRAHAPAGDPGLHASLAEVFGGAVRVVAEGGRHRVLSAW